MLFKGLGARIDFLTAADAEGMMERTLEHTPPALGASIAGLEYGVKAQPTAGL